jgi:hypothetical protein
MIHSPLTGAAFEIKIHRARLDRPPPLIEPAPLTQITPLGPIAVPRAPDALERRQCHAKKWLEPAWRSSRNEAYLFRYRLNNLGEPHLGGFAASFVAQGMVVAAREIANATALLD